MDDLKLLEAVERYMSGDMTKDEQLSFEKMRLENMEIDQLIVEQSLFLKTVNGFEEKRQFKNMLKDIHLDLIQSGDIVATTTSGKGKLVSFIEKYKKSAMLAASVAGITALFMSALVWSLSPTVPHNKEIKQLSKEINVLKNHNRLQDRAINQVKDHITTVPPIIYTTGGTGFLIHQTGLLVTNAHVIKNAKNIAVQKTNGQDLKAKVVFVDDDRDLAIIQIIDEAYKSPLHLPYSIKSVDGDIAEPVYTLGFPRNEIVYGEGYLSAKTGYDGDTLTYQIAIAANPGNSGGPIVNKNGEVIGILSTKQTSAEGVVFATQSKYIYQALEKVKKDTSFLKVKMPTTSSLKGLDRVQQVKKISDYVYMVKVN